MTLLSIKEYIQSGVIYRFRKVFDFLIQPIYCRSINKKKRRIIQKGKIKVAFVLTELGTWKTEYLYHTLQRHPQFTPKIFIAKKEGEEKFYETLIEYLQKNKFEFVDLTDKGTLSSTFHPDIIFYQKPYDVSVPNKLNFRRNLYALFCYINYGFHSLNEKWLLDTPLCNYSWQVYFENERSTNGAKRLMRNHGKNIVITGLPMSEEFLKPIDCYKDPWKIHDKKRKRIIWAPHHTIGDFDHKGINYATFLQYAQFMVKMAQKYKESIDIAFKPHPILYYRLVDYWGKEKTDTYYHLWDSMPNSQLIKGRYIELFMHSDAMIHDCSSFTIEYLYTQKPVMFLTKDDNTHIQNLNDFAIDAFKLHYIGKNQDDIETFIQDVIHNIDPRKEERKVFYHEALLPPNNQSASENIIDCILGKH